MGSLATDSRRKDPRVKAPRELQVAWKSSGLRSVSRAETIAIGGLFLYTKTPPAAGAMIELVFDLEGREVRARAIVRHATSGKGMGVQFTHMASDCRAKLNQYLSKYTKNITLGEKLQSPPPSIPPPTEAQVAETHFEAELTDLLTLAKTGTHYQLLGVTPNTSSSAIKQKFYALAQKFHPDHHMHLQHCLGMLKELTAALTEAYKTLSDETKRTQYDKHLETTGAFGLGRGKTKTQLVIEDSVARAKECIRAGNFVGSIVWLKKCVQLAPNDPSHHTLLARSLGKVPQYRTEAIGHFQRAIELDPWKLDVYSQLADLYENMGLQSQAKLVYSKILAIDPVHGVSRQHLGLSV